MSTLIPTKDEATEEETSTDSTYCDYANETEDAKTLQQEKNSADNSSFPVKLHYMLSDMQADGLDHVVSWQPHGRCFIVHKPDFFGEKILPLWFRQSKYSSFQRQLNLYGFKRISAGPDKGAHYHELFLRGKPDLTYRIRRMKIKGQGARKPANPKKEPDFYSLSFLPPDNVPAASANKGPTAAMTTAMAMMSNHRQNTVMHAPVAAGAVSTPVEVQQRRQQVPQSILATRLSADVFVSPPLLSYLMAMGGPPVRHPHLGLLYQRRCPSGAMGFTARGTMSMNTNADVAMNASSSPRSAPNNRKNEI